MQKNITTETEYSTNADSVTLSAWLGALKILFWNKLMRIFYAGFILIIIAAPLSEYCYWHCRWLWTTPLFIAGILYSTIWDRIFNRERA